MESGVSQAQMNTVRSTIIYVYQRIFCDLVPGVEDKLPALTPVSWAFDGQRSEEARGVRSLT